MKLALCSVLAQMKKKFTTFLPFTVHPSTAEFDDQLKKFVSICNIVKKMRQMRLGAVGARTTAFKSVRFDEMALESHGIDVESYDMSNVFVAIKDLADNDEAVQNRLADLHRVCDYSGAPEGRDVTLAKFAVVIDNMLRDNKLEYVPVVVSSTFTYDHMAQCKRMLHCGDPKLGLISNMAHLHALCDDKHSPYRNVVVLPHLDHADPIKDRWVLTVGSQYFSSVMFDAQRFPYEENLKMTHDYVDAYGKDVLVEGIMEMLNVEGSSRAAQADNYCERAKEFVDYTGIDFMVADLGTEQQAATTGAGTYYGDRARKLTEVLGKKMLVLHGTSCLTNEQIRGLSDDGVLRVNMWTRIAREAGQFAAKNAIARLDQMEAGVFDAADSYRYIQDCTEYATDMMVELMESFGYGNWKC